MKDKGQTGYALSRRWFIFSMDAKECKPVHTAIYFWIVELNNRLSWKPQFGLPTGDTMEVLSIGNKRTYLAALRDIEKWGFIKIVQHSENQYKSCVVELCYSNNAPALDTALPQDSPSTSSSTSSSIAPIDKPIKTIKTLKQNGEVDDVDSISHSFDSFWKAYPKKVSKKDCEIRWGKLTKKEKEMIMKTLPAFLAYKPFPTYNYPDPKTYLNNKRWEDEIPTNKDLSTNQGSNNGFDLYSKPMGAIKHG